MRIGIRVLALVGLLSACAPEFGDTAETTQAAIGPATITTSASSYTFLTSVPVTWSGMPATSGSYIAMAPQGSPNTTITRWTPTGGNASGSYTFEGPPAAGTYVIRGFGADDSFQGESDPFTVEGAGTATVAPSATTYTMTDPIVINWSGMPGNATDWISIAPVGSADTTTADWLYTGGGTSGTTTFMDGLAPTTYPPGTYVARAFINDSFTKIGESAPFDVTLQAGVTVTTDATSYSVNQAITVTWMGMPGNQNDWIAIAPSQSQTISNPTVWIYTNGQVNGSHTFTSGITIADSYVARAFENDTYNLLAQSPAFTVTAVSGVTITTNASMYALGAPVTVTWSGAPTNATDWVAISPAGSSDTTVTRWVYTGGQANGSFVFEGPPAPGTYVARFYVNDSYTKVAESASFTVQ